MPRLIVLFLSSALALAPSVARGKVSVEIHLEICSASPAEVLRRLEIEGDSPDEAFKVFLFDTPTAAFFEAGAVLRLRRYDDEDEVTLKVRGIDPEALASHWLEEPGFKCEKDRFARGSLAACSLKEEGDPATADAAVKGKIDIARLFTGEQRRFLKEHAETPPWEKLQPMGPIRARTWDIVDAWDGGDVRLEHWRLDGDHHVLELSTKAGKSGSPGEFVRRLRSFVKEKGLSPCSDPEGKVKRALDYFTGR